ncbi:hypothetical protein [Clostridioides difficile]|nr:hypothetical protein [Clostridioides difficile]
MRFNDKSDPKDISILFNSSKKILNVSWSTYEERLNLSR